MPHTAMPLQNDRESIYMPPRKKVGWDTLLSVLERHGYPTAWSIAIGILLCLVLWFCRTDLILPVRDSVLELHSSLKDTAKKQVEIDATQSEILRQNAELLKEIRDKLAEGRR